MTPSQGNPARAVSDSGIAWLDHLEQRARTALENAPENMRIGWSVPINANDLLALAALARRTRKEPAA